MASRPLIKECLALLNITGLNPCRNDTFSKFRAVVVTCLMAYLMLETCLFCLLKWTGLESIEALTSLFAIYESLNKICSSINQRRNLQKVLMKMDNFSPINIYGVKIENTIENIITLFKKVTKFACVFIIILLPAYFAKPFYGKVRTMPLHAYHPADLNKYPNFEIAYSCQVVTMLLSSTSIFAINGLFLALIITIICQLKVVKEGFHKISIDIKIKGDSDENLCELNKLIDQHNLILDCIKDITEIYSILLLQTYFTCMFNICAGLVAIISSGIPPSLDALYKNGLFLAYFIGQLYFYCATGSNLTEESASVSAVVYNTQWYVKTQPELRRACVMIIQRANKGEALTAGGMFSLNLDSFRKVIKAGLSFFTLVQAMYKDKN